MALLDKVSKELLDLIVLEVDLCLWLEFNVPRGRE